MQQIAREANTKFWGIGQSFVTLTLRFDMHDIRAFGPENWPFVRLHGTKKTPCWMANGAEGKKSKEITSFKKHISFLFTFPLRRCHPARCFFVPCDRILQKAHTGQ